MTTPSSSPSASSIKLPVSSRESVHTISSLPELPSPEPPKPSIRLLFSFLTRHDLLFLVFPAVFTSVCAGAVAPFMTMVIGKVFDTFANYPLTANPPESVKKQLLHDIGLNAIQLLGLALGALALSSLTSSLWIWTGERNLLAVRKQVYGAVTCKDIVWFDTKMGADESITANGDGPIGAGGLMAKFARETDEIRSATSLASGMFIQYLTTIVVCLILGFTRSWALTLVILSAVPALMIIQAFSQVLAGPRLNMERMYTASAATLVDRAVNAITTIKAFNAQAHEEKTLAVFLDKLQASASGCITVWGFTSTLSQFSTMAMFVQGFWFGSKLVRSGAISPGDVMAVFWACLIATSNLQMCVPQLIVIAKGKFAMASLLGLVESTVTSLHRSGSTPYAPLKGSKKTNQLRKIVPPECQGGIDLVDVTFAYPSRPTMPVLRDVNIFLPASETTFVVGASGSGKSTVAQLLLRMYDLDDGTINLDDQDISYLDVNWTREHIASVSQTCILFDMSVHDNVAMGLASPWSKRQPRNVTRAEVEAVCRAALMHEFIRDLPEGYDTKLGNGGANLSGGQKQRLAIARALLRNPTILILDEATSALDATSRILVFEAIKQWRQNMTNIVITHDLSQVTPGDFVYVLKGGEVVEQGYRHDLEGCFDSEFYRMLCIQGAAGGHPQDQDDAASIQVGAILEQHDAGEDNANASAIKHQSVFRPLTSSNWMFDAISDLTRMNASAPSAAPILPPIDRVSRFTPAENFAEVPLSPRRQSLHIEIPAPPSPVYDIRRHSLPFTPTSPITTRSTASLFSATVVGEDEVDEKAALEHFALRSVRSTNFDSPSAKRVRRRWDEPSITEFAEIKIEKSVQPEEQLAVSELGFFALIRAIWPTIPVKPLFFLGLIVSLASGAMTPAFSFVLSRLQYEVSTGAQDLSVVNLFGGISLAIAFADGLFIGLKYFILEHVAIEWVNRVRKTCYHLVLSQDKKWFDKTDNSAVRLVQILIKDGDDARTLIATVFAQSLVVIAMLGVGLIWALVQGWQLTLVGFAIAPVFALCMAFQTRLVANCELRNKRAREEVAKGYYEAISNVRGIRAMGFEGAFQAKFDKSVDNALSAGVRGAFVEGCTHGVASALIYMAEAVLFYVGAVLVANGTYDYLRMVQVLNLVVFTVTIGSQLMAFTQSIAKSVQATRDLYTILQLSEATDESRGISRPPVMGTVSFNNVSFSYPERSDVPVLKNLSLSIQDSECVAVVGASGSGKSTVASLLQRLYEPTSGNITIGPNQLDDTDVHYLRDHVAVVSQQPNLFDATIAENIAYGNESLSEADIRTAARAANVHDFVMSLPKGYETHLGENASLISGGQAQRLQIARALAKPSRILILDECTSALDPANQVAVMETIKQAKVGRTTLIVTHKLPVMQMCDRIIVIHEGVVAESGTYNELMARRGIFAQLAGGGEWMD